MLLTLAVIAGCSEIEPSPSLCINARAAFLSEDHASQKCAWGNNSATCCKAGLLFMADAVQLQVTNVLATHDMINVYDVRYSRLKNSARRENRKSDIRP
jgi:hypothetical protein